MLRESGLSAIPDSLQTDIYLNHTCSICKKEPTPESKSLLHHYKLSKYINVAKDIEPPQPLPTQWTYKPPPIFIPLTHRLETAVTLQKLLEYGMSFQPKQTPNPTPFLTPFDHLLNLKTNTPPLTQFLTDSKRDKTYRRFNTLLKEMKDALKTDKLSIVACDKGPGLLLMGNNTLQSTYQEYLKGNSFITSNLDIKKALLGLKNSLLEVDSRASIINTDDRVPTFYFKIKTHKNTFTTNTTRFSEIFSYNLGPKTLAKIARPVVNHKTSITCLSSQYLRKFITPIIEQSPYLTQDIFHTIDRLCRLGRPDYIYTGDIEAFYPSTPHSLVLQAFRHYQH